MRGIVATLALSGTLGAVTVFLLISLLSTREIVTADSRRTLKAFGRSLDVGIIPLLVVFAVIVVTATIGILA